MRTASAFRLIIPTLAVLAAACDDAASPLQPHDPLENTPEAALVDTERWADGYLFASQPATASYSPDPSVSFNRAGQSIQITKPAGTTGRYLLKFSGLSELLGTKRTLQVTAFGARDAYCKPVTAYLTNSQAEVRCYQAATGAAVNADFNALVLRKRDHLAFAYAHRPTESNYVPQGNGSWNPKGAIRVLRSAIGTYQVLFTGLGALPASAGNGGTVKVSAVGPGKNFCKVTSWGGNPNLGVSVACYSQAGVPTDSKFNVLFLMPHQHLAYAWAEQPTTPSYSSHPYYRFNPMNGGVTITRTSAGRYRVQWAYVDPSIIGYGNVQVTAYGTGNTQCTVDNWDLISAYVRCFSPTGALVDSYFTALLGS